MNTPPSAPASRAAITFILVTVVIDVLSFGLIIPVLPKLVEAFEGGNTAKAAITYGIFGTAWALMQFFFMPILGALSDRFGRRPVILLSCLGLAVDFVLMALAPTLLWLFIGRIISGITAASFSTASAYVADVTAPENRAAAFGMMGAAFGFGFVIGPAVGGGLGSIDPRLPFWVAAGLAFCNVLYGYFVLPESLPPEKRSAFSWSRANPVGALKLLKSHPQLSGLATAHFFMQLSHAVYPSIAVLYMGYRYQWNSRDVGWALALVGVMSIIVQGALVKPVVKRLGERITLVVGLAAATVGVAGYGVASSGTMFLAIIPITALWGLATAAVQSLMTQRVTATEQGKLQGANGALFAIASLIGPTLFTQAFSRGIDAHGVNIPGAPFYIAAVLLAAAGVAAWQALGRAQ